MDYFCARCQKRHPISDISVDMLSVCMTQFQLTNKVQNIISPTGSTDETLTDLSDAFVRVLHSINSNQGLSLHSTDEGITENAQANAYLAVNAGNTDRWIKNRRKTSRLVEGDYELTFGDLRKLVVDASSPDLVTSNDITAVRNSDLSKLDSEVVLREPIQITFQNPELVDSVYNADSVPFEDKSGYRHICSHCGCQITRAAGRAEEIVVALAGSPRAGKTSCIVAMLSALRRNLISGIRLEDIYQDAKWDSLLTQVSKYEKCQKVDKTPERPTEVPSYSLLITLADHQNTQRVITMVDMPGEYMQGDNGLQIDFYKEYSGIYRNIDCIWYVLSKATVWMSQMLRVPEQYEETLKDLTSEDIDVIRKTNPSNLNRTLHQINALMQNNLSRPMPPTVVILSKPDYIVSQQDMDATRRTNLFPVDCLGTETGRVNEMMLMQVNNEEKDNLVINNENWPFGLNPKNLCIHSRDVCDYINSANSEFCQAFTRNCPDLFFTSLSPYGQPAQDPTADSEGNFTNPSPYHELNPLLWTLAILGAMDIYQDIHWSHRNILGTVVKEERQTLLISFSCQNDPPVDQLKKKEKANLQVIYDTIRNNLLLNGPEFLDYAELPYNPNL